MNFNEFIRKLVRVLGFQFAKTEAFLLKMRKRIYCLRVRSKSQCHSLQAVQSLNRERFSFKRSLFTNAVQCKLYSVHCTHFAKLEFRQKSHSNFANVNNVFKMFN